MASAHTSQHTSNHNVSQSQHNTSLHNASSYASQQLATKSQTRIDIITNSSLKQGDHATVYWPNTKREQASYRGEWLDDKRHGYGVQVYPGGKLKYEGQWQDDERSGEGVLWVIGAKKGAKKSYIGEWSADQYHGKGVIVFDNGEEYEGEFKHGKLSGEGEMRYNDGSIYNGTWHDGVRSGYGILRKADGGTYEGYWVDDKREGSGSYFYVDGKVFVGEWANDQGVSGVYQQATQNPDEPGDLPVTSTLPRIKLAQPDVVISEMLTSTRKNRCVYRILNLPLEKLYSDSELEELSQVYYQYAAVDDVAELKEYIAALEALEITDVSERMLEDFIAQEEVYTGLCHRLDLDIPNGDEIIFDFVTFARILAVLLEMGNTDSM